MERCALGRLAEHSERKNLLSFVAVPVDASQTDQTHMFSGSLRRAVGRLREKGQLYIKLIPPLYLLFYIFRNVWTKLI